MKNRYRPCLCRGGFGNHGSRAVKKEDSIIEDFQQLRVIALRNLAALAGLSTIPASIVLCAFYDEIVRSAEFCIKIIGDYCYESKLLGGDGLLEMSFEIAERKKLWQK